MLLSIFFNKHQHLQNMWRYQHTAIQLPAENVHLEVVVMLTNAGGIPDGLSLHDFAFNGHKLVVKYLLNVGVKDTCVQGTPSPIVVTGAGPFLERPVTFRVT